MAKGYILVDGLATDLFVILAIERKVTSKHQINDNSERPAVNALIVWLLEKDFWRNVAQSTIGFPTGLSWAKCAR